MRFLELQWTLLSIIKKSVPQIVLIMRINERNLGLDIINGYILLKISEKCIGIGAPDYLCPPCTIFLVDNTGPSSSFYF